LLYKKYIKNLSDRILATIAVISLSWLFIIIMIIIKATSKGPIFFLQRRVGVNKSIFNILKFRTMKIDTPSNVPTHMLEDPDQYITSVGKFLRRTSLDELPQLFNIMLGQMSIVGPRPALWNQYDLIEERDKYGANEVKPGLTGWAQINGRDEIPIPIKAMLDGEYINKMSLFFDIKCIIKTAFSVLRHEGIKEGI
jgi:O-antigen biosynthesis protein WbqP